MITRNDHNSEQKKDLSYVASLSKTLGGSVDLDQISSVSDADIANVMDIDPNDVRNDPAKPIVDEDLLFPNIVDSSEISLSELIVKLNQIYNSVDVKDRLSIRVEVHGAGTIITDVRSDGRKVVLTLG
jgi:hypothetical protein